MLGIILARQIFNLSFAHIVLVFAGFICLLILFIKTKNIKRFVLLIVVFLVGVVYFFVGTSVFFGKNYESNVFVSGRVCAIYDGNNYKILTLDSIQIDGDKKMFNISLSVSGEFEIELGSEVFFEGKLNKVEIFTQDGYKSYYYKNNTPYKSNTTYENIIVRKGYLKLDEKIRQYFTKFLEKHLSKEMSGLITTVMFGDKTTLNPEIDDAYMDSGMAHLLAVSGMHIVLIVSLISYILKKLKTNKWLNFFLLFILLLFFTYLCDWAPSIVRALIMSLIFYFSLVVGKKYDKLNSLGLCAIIILIFKPLYVFDAGFLLSFACVFCIFTLTKPIKNQLIKFNLNPKISNSLSLVISVQIGLIPILTVYNNNFNVFSLLINLICVPFFEFAFMLTFISVPVCMILPFLSFFLKILEVMYAGVTLLANFVGSLSWANLPLYAFNDVLVISSYISIFTFSNYVNLNKNYKTICVCLIMALGFFCTFLTSVI